MMLHTFIMYGLSEMAANSRTEYFCFVDFNFYFTVFIFCTTFMHTNK